MSCLPSANAAPPPAADSLIHSLFLVVLLVLISASASAAQLVYPDALACGSRSADSVCQKSVELPPQAVTEVRNGLCRVGSPDIRPVSWFDYCSPDIYQGHVMVCRYQAGARQICGLVDQDGRLRLPALYEEVELGPLSPVARIRLNGRWGYYDTEKGQIIFAPQFPKANAFSEGVAYVVSPGENESMGHWIIDRSGRRGEALDSGITEVGLFREGLARARQGGLWGYLSREGEWKIPPQFSYAEDFLDGLAAVRVADNPEQWALIDREGRGQIFIEGDSHQITLFERHQVQLEWGCEVLADGARRNCTRACLLRQRLDGDKARQGLVCE